MKTSSILIALALGASSSLLSAQGNTPHAGGQPGRGGQRPPNPIIEALDLNRDGTINADELATAGESLKKLDKNSDGKLTEDEFRPQRPGGTQGGGRPQGQGGPQGPPPEQ